MKGRSMKISHLGENATLVGEMVISHVTAQKGDEGLTLVGIIMVEDTEAVREVVTTITIEEDINPLGLQVKEVQEGVQEDIEEGVGAKIKIEVEAEIVTIGNQRVEIGPMKVRFLEIMIINHGGVKIAKAMIVIIIHIIKMRKILIMKNIILIQSKIKYIILLLYLLYNF
jgi:hypothetical protein